VAFTNKAVCSSTGGQGGTYTSPVVTSAAVTVEEPVLQVSELVATNNSAGKYGPSVIGLQGNDTIYYQITITNVGLNFTNTTAYNLWVSNALPADLVNAAVVSVNTYGGVYTNDTAPTTGVIDPSMFVINGNNVLTNVAGAQIALDANAGLVLVVSGKLSPTINPQTVLLDTNTIEWASLPDTQTNLSSWSLFGNSRTGVSTPLPGAGVSNYFVAGLLDSYAAASKVTTATVISPSFAKALAGGDHTAAGLGASDVVVGERVFYTLTLTVPQGDTPNVVITDTLPQGLGFVGVTNVSWSVGVSNALPILVETNA